MLIKMKALILLLCFLTHLTKVYCQDSTRTVNIKTVIGFQAGTNLNKQTNTYSGLSGAYVDFIGKSVVGPENLIFAGIELDYKSYYELSKENIRVQLHLLR